MAIFTALATMLAATELLAGTFLATQLGVGLMAAGMAIATSVAVSAVMKSLAGEPEAAKADHFGTQGTLAAGGDIPRSFGLGKHMTAGSLTYANYWGRTSETPNAYLTQVICVSDLPREQLIEVWIQGEKVTLSGPVDASMGQSVAEYAKAGVQHLWIKYYDGTQTAADTFLTGTVSSTDRPYGATRIGTGVCYVICTALVDDTLFTGFPAFKFVMSGIPLYDPSKDSTNGGSGSQRYSNPATWGGDGDQFPAVQVYNVLRGIHYGSAWVYGLQNMTGAARLPAANWNAQIAKCRATVTGLSGLEPTYRAGGQVNVNSQPANAIEALLTACGGRLSEIGGFYKIHLGAPDTATFSWLDADLLSSEQQTFRPFFSLADSINGIQGTFPNPLEGWETATAPPLYRTDLEVRDGNRRLMAAPSFDFVPYPEQVQRLQKSGIEESQRARTHVLPLPPAYWVVEPGDVGTWNSFRNGYVDKLFRVDSVVDRSNLDVSLAVTEIDPADYDWNHATDYTGVITGPTVFSRPAPQGVVDWFAEGWVLYDAAAAARRAAIRIAWDGSLPGVVGMQYEVRLTADLSHVTRGRTDQLSVGALVISQGIIPLTAYQVRGQYLPSSPRDMLWSDWLDVTTPDVVSDALPAWIIAQTTTVTDYINDRLTELEQRIATYTSTDMARNWSDHKETRSQMASRSDAAFAEIAHVETVATSADAAMASEITTLTASVGSNTASINTHSTAIASIEGWGATNYGVTLDVNGYSSGFELLNGGGGISSATFIQDKFQIAAPGVSGGAAVPIFTVANVGGSPKVALRGDMFVDGSINAVSIVADSITATQIQAGAINTTELAINSVDIMNIIDGAASNTTAASGTSPVGSGTICSLTLDIQNGRAIVWAIAYAMASPSAVANLVVDGGTVRTVSSPTTIMHYLTGLSAGNHTFTLTVNTGSTPGQLVVNNPRR